uniref:Uncharacterized protein n=1 Tax=Oryza barthii TaxID=65489 RepID=A0A0D3GTZ2_9ORYZ
MADRVHPMPAPPLPSSSPPPAPPRVLCRLQRVPPPGPPRRRPVARVPPGAEERDGVLDGVDRRRRELHGGVEEAARSARCP